MARKTPKKSSDESRSLNPEPVQPKCPNCNGETVAGCSFYNTRDMMRYEPRTCTRCSYKFVSMIRLS